MKKFFSLFLLQLSFIGIALAQNEISVSSVDRFSDEGVDYEIVNISFKNTDAVNSIAFHLNYPEGYKYEMAEVTENGRLGVKKVGKWSATWTNPTVGTVDAYEKPYKGFVTCATYNSVGSVLESGEGDILTFYFSVDPTVGYAEGYEYLLNNASLGDIDGNTVPATWLLGYVGKGGYSTYCSIEDVLIEGAEAYFATIDDDGETVVLKQATDNTVYHGNGVILKGKEGAKITATSLATAPAKEDNVLSAAIIGIDAETPVHVLSTNDGVTGFYTYTGWIPAGKAYLEGFTGAKVNVRFADETGIEEISAEDLNGVIFNLNGQKVNEVKKGIHVVNGKKVMF